MTFQFVKFGWDGEHSRPSLTVRPLVAPGAVRPRFDALGAADEMADTMFALLDRNDVVIETWRPEPMQVVVLEAMLDAGAYTLHLVDTHDELSLTQTLACSEYPHLDDVVMALKNADTGYIE